MQLAQPKESRTVNIFTKTLKRDLKISLRKPSSFLNPILFFVIAISLFPLAISPESHTLSNIAPGIVCVACMLSVLLSLNALFHYDYDNGVLEQIVISHHSLPLILLAKTIAHWLLTGLPIILLSPLLGMTLFLNADTICVLMLILL